jgi:hypothetical protein
MDYSTDNARGDYFSREKAVDPARHSSKLSGFLGLGLARGNPNNFDECLAGLVICSMDKRSL